MEFENDGEMLVCLDGRWGAKRVPALAARYWAAGFRNKRDRGICIYRSLLAGERFLHSHHDHPLRHSKCLARRQGLQHHNGLALGEGMKKEKLASGCFKHVILHYLHYLKDLVNIQQ